MKEKLKNFISFIWKRITFKRFIIILILFIFILPALFGSEDLENKYEYKFLKGNKESLNKILVIPIKGIILTESSVITNPLDFLQEYGVVYGYEVKDSLIRASSDSSIKGIFLEINSPGGTIPGSQAIADGINYYIERTKKPVFAHIRDVGASGAYWAAIVANKVYADSGSMIGSIGVIVGPFKYYNTVLQEGNFLESVSTEKGIETTYFIAGQYKDTGSPYRKLTSDEIAHWQKTVDNEYENFVNHVSKYRKLSKDLIINKIKALPYDSKSAVSLGLIDGIESEENVITELLAKSRVPRNDYQIIYEKQKKSILSDLLSAFSKPITMKEKNVCMLCNTPLYLYDSTLSFFGN